jgi:ABC-type transport system involved in multi-copper enzyme maturation permease subunit
MGTLLAIARFEVRSRLHLLSTYVYFAVFLGLAFLFTIAAGGAFKNAAVTFGTSKLFINSPYALIQTISVLGYLGLLVTAAMMGRAVQQDFEYETYHFFFTAPITRAQYFFGRFLGALATLVLIFASVALGCWLGVRWPTVDPARVGPTVPLAYLHPYLVSVIPNLVITGSIFFGLGALIRRMMPVYVSGVVLLIGWLISGRLMRDIESKWVSALLDPFGNRALHHVTEYWPIAERNSRLVPLESYFLYNRLLWLAVGLGVLALCFWRFRFAHAHGAGGGSKKQQAAVPEGDRPAPGTPPPRVDPVFTAGSALRMLPGLTWMTFRETVKSVYFLVIVLAGVLFCFVASSSLDNLLLGTASHPVTYLVLELTSGTFAAFMIIIITVYSGELVWREREARLSQIHDALPVPGWLPLTSKLLALMGTQVALTAVVMVCGLLIQLFKGYFRFELGLYVRMLFGINLVEYLLICVLAMTVQVLVNHKYVGHLVMVLYWMALLFSSQLGLEHFLYRFGETPGLTYSDMNGFGHFMAAIRWFNLYWAAGALLLAAVAHLFWVRGTDTAPGVRLRLARQRLTGRTGAVIAAGVLTFAAAGAFIFYNTNVLNPYRTTFEVEEEAARYEKQYRALIAEPQPKVTGVQVAVDLFPEERRASLKGTLTLKNKTDRDVSTVYLNLPTAVQIRALSVDRPHRLERNDALGFHAARLDAPLRPGEEAALTFDVGYGHRGFRVREQMNGLAANGTFINSELVPAIGYQEARELEDDNDRRKHGLQPKERMRDRDDPEGLKRNYITADSDWVTFEATVSTSPDQLALAPGYLQREWTENGRRHFHYRMDAPILNFYSFLSARWAVKRDAWRDVAIEVYYHPTHTFNVDRMIESVKASLEYCTAAFGPYQHRQVRILEFPRYASFAQSFPNTIPYSESIGFIARVREKDERDVELPYFVTAHEVAHQWWAHQVIGGHVQGSTMLSETLAEYTALMVMKRKYGADRMRRFLRHELDRYLRERAVEKKKELPLSRVENQPYIHYAKGGHVMFALADLIGEEAVNRGVKAFLDETRYQGPPYPGSTALLRHLRAVTPPEHQPTIDDWFERITLYENRATEGRYSRRPDGKYDVKVKVMAKKVQADELGGEVEQKISDWIEVGVLDEEDRPILLEKRKFVEAEYELTFVVDRKPAKAGIDPVMKLVDRSPEDNAVTLEEL